MPTAAQKCISVLKHYKLTLALAESVTSGLAAHDLAGTIGTSEVLMGAIVCYHENVKCGLLKVPKKMVQTFTCESIEVTERLAKNLKKCIKADVYAAITGLAAPGASESAEKPVGTIFISVCFGKQVVNSRFRFYGSPLTVRKKAANALLEAVASVVSQWFIAPPRST